MSDRTISVEVPERTVAGLASRLPRTEFDSVDDYASAVLEQVLAELHRQETDSGSTTAPDGDTPPDDAVADQLESLGYL